MLKKLLNNYLDNYYTNKFIEYISRQIRFRFNLDIEVKKYKNGMVDINAKPTHFNKFTHLLEFHKGDSLNHLVSLRDIETELVIEKINDLNKTDEWKKI